MSFVSYEIQAVRNKEIDVKGAADLLGVSYGTLYGRYRELFGYVKHAWNLAGRPMKLMPMPGEIDKEQSAMFWTDPKNQEVLDRLKNGDISMRQASQSLAIDPFTLSRYKAYHLSEKV